MTEYTFDGDVAIVTGGGSGIGRVTATEFGAAGAAVVVADVDTEGGAETVEVIEAEGGSARFVEADVTDPAAVERMVAVAVEAFGGLDYAVNNAGIPGETAPLADQDRDRFIETVMVNLVGVADSMRAELPAMVADGGGAIVNVASILGKVGYPKAAAYVAAKHGVLGLTKTTALEYAADDVRVTAVCPGFTETDMVVDIGVSEGAVRDRIAADHALNRFGEPAEVAAAILWLCSSDASFVTGTGVDVDGGYLAQ